MAPLLTDPSRAAVFLDFDGTITTADVGQHLLNRLASPEWIELHDAYGRGEIDSRELLLDQWDLVRDPTDEAKLREVAREVPVDPGFERFVAAVRDAGAELTVVSDGFGFYVEEVCAPYDLPVLTNAIDFETGRLDFPNMDRCCPCSSCGVCKQAPIKDAKYAGKTTVLVGDGVSDRKAALLVDVLVAKDELASWCEVVGVPYHPFHTLDDARALLLGPDDVDRRGRRGSRVARAHGRARRSAGG